MRHALESPLIDPALEPARSAPSLDSQGVPGAAKAFVDFWKKRRDLAASPCVPSLGRPTANRPPRIRSAPGGPSVQAPLQCSGVRISLMKKTRRQILELGLGAGQLALLSSFGLLGARRAQAAPGSGPTKLLTISVPGGWMPIYLWCPLTDAQISSHIPSPRRSSGEQAFFLPEQVENLDGSANGETEDGFPKLRVPNLWDIEGNDRAPHGYAWRHYGLHENHSVVHGVDMGTPAHESGRISSMCGVAGSVYRAPAMHAVVANALHERFADQRPIASVAVGDAPVPNPHSLPPTAAPTLIPNLDILAESLSERSDSAWAGLRNRGPAPDIGYDGSHLGADIGVNPMDSFALERIRGLRGAMNPGTDRFYERLHDTYRTVSKQLARDVVSVLERTAAVDPERDQPPPWITSNPNWGYFSSDIGPGISSDSGGTWAPSFNLALKLLKSDLCTSVSLNCWGLGHAYFDHHSAGHAVHFPLLRSAWDVIGRLLAEMKASPSTQGQGSLLDDTVVVIMSEFARTWPGSGTCDHWPITSVALAGGGVLPNRMIGGYDLSRGSPRSIGFEGLPVDLRLEGGSDGHRAPTSGDICHTVYQQLGIREFFIPGGSGEIMGLRA